MSIYTLNQLFSILKSSKKYSGHNFSYESEDIIYSIGDKKYKINCEIFSSKFKYYNYKLNIKTIEVNYKEDNIISKFGEFIRIIKKLNKIIIQKEKIEHCVKNSIKSYVKNEYNIDLDFNNIERFDFSILNKTVAYRRKYKSLPFDVKKDNPDTIKYRIYINFKETEKIIHRLYFEYSVLSNNLILSKKELNYINDGNDITPIIRSEKLKKLNFLANV